MGCRGMPVYSERHIYIIGSQLLLGELMAAQIENHTGANCHVVGQLDKIKPLPTPKKVARNLHLVDCHGLTSEALKAKIISDFSEMGKSGYWAMFNLTRSLGIEKQALSHGTRGFFYTDDRLQTILRGTSLILDGELWASRKTMSECFFSLSSPDRSGSKTTLILTRREVEILSLLAEGEENGSIANSLYISPHTVRTHLYHIFKKLKVKNRLQAVQWAIKNL